MCSSGIDSRFVAGVRGEKKRSLDVEYLMPAILEIEVEGGGDNSDIEIDRPIFLRRTSRVGRGVVREQKEQKEEGEIDSAFCSPP